MRTTGRVLWSAAAAVATAAALYLRRDLRPEHLAIIGLAAGALAYSAIRTGERLYALWRRGNPWQRGD